MKDLLTLTARRAANETLHRLLRRQVDYTKGGRPKIDASAAKKFRNFAPVFETRRGDVAAVLREVTFSQKNGETIAYYDLVRHDQFGRKMVTTYLYGIRGGAPKQLRAYDTRYVN